jgi:PEP-CTERM motif
VNSLVRTAVIMIGLLAGATASANPIGFGWQNHHRWQVQRHHSSQNQQNQPTQQILDQPCYTCGVDSQGGPTASVPEPATLALFGAALLGFGAARRRLKPIQRS